MTDLIARRIKETDGRVSAKRLLPEAQAGGYRGSARNFRRAVAPIRADWRRRRRSYRPWVPIPGEHLVIDGAPRRPAGVLRGLGVEPLAVRTVRP